METFYNWLLEWGGWIIVTLIGVLGIRGVIKFDVNECLRDRRKHKIEILNSLCPHVWVEFKDDQTLVHSSWISPSGTDAWQCQQCKRITHDHESTVNDQTYWTNNLEELIKRNEKREKLSKKLGL